MFCVYVLKSLKDRKRYVGFTNNFARRFSEHKLGKCKSTKNRLPFELILREEYNTKEEAMAREKFLKSGKGREYLNKI